MIGISEMSAHAGSEFDFVDEFIRVGGVLKGNLDSKQIAIKM